MAIIKIRASSGSVSGYANYLKQEEKTEQMLIDTKDCTINFARDFSITKNNFKKNEGVQFHEIIQSFKIGETSAEQAHKIGIEFLKNEKFKEFQVVLVTHKDKEHIHNHIVINSVSHITGKKFQQNMIDLKIIKEHSNELCKLQGLSVLELEKKATKYINIKENQILKSGKKSEKEELRECIIEAKKKVNSLEDLKDYLEINYKIETKLQNKKIKFKHQDSNKFIDGRKLGAEFEKEALEIGIFRRETQSTREQEIEEIRKEKTKELKQKKQEITALYNQKSTLKTDTEDVVNYKRQIEQNYQFSQYKKNIKEDKEKLVNIYKKYISKEKLQEIKSNYIINFNKKIYEIKDIKNNIHIETTREISIFNFTEKKVRKENIKKYEINLEKTRDELNEIDKNFYQIDFAKISQSLEKEIDDELQVVNEEYKKLEKELQKYEQIESVEYENMQECKLLYMYKTDDYVYLSDQKVKIIADLQIDKCNIYKNMKSAIKDLENHDYKKSEKQLEIEELAKARKKSNYLER